MSIFSNMPFKSKTLYSSIIFSFCLSIVVTILILSTVLYLNFENIGLSITNSFIKESLKQVSYSSTLMLNTAKTAAFQISFDPRVSNLLTYEQSNLDEAYGLSQLSVYRNTSPFIDSIYIYNGITKTFYVSSSNVKTKYLRNEFFDKDILSILDNIRNYKSPVLIPRSSNILLTGIDKSQVLNVYSFILYNFPGKKGDLDSAIILNISEEWMRNTIDSLESVPDSDTFIINSEGKTVVRSLKNGMLDNLSGTDYVREILSANSPSGYFSENVNGVKSLVTYLNSDFFDWKFIRITPYSEITGRINDMRIITLILCFIILIVGLLLSFIVSKFLYKPIDNIIKKLNNLETEKRNNLYYTKQEFLRSLLHNEVYYTNETLQNKLSNTNITLNSNGSFVLIILKIDSFSAFCNEYCSNDRAILRYGIMNISSELCAAHFENEAIDICDDHIVLILNLSGNDTADIRKTVHELVRNIQSAVLKHLEISLSAAISCVGDTLSSINVLYEEAQNTSSYLIFHNTQHIIFAEDLKSLKFKEYSYPIQREKYMLDMLKLGKVSEAKSCYLEIINETTNYSLNVFRSAVSHLIYAISTVIDAIEKGAGLTMFYNLDRTYTNLNKFESLDEVNKHFFTLFDDIAKTLDERKNSKSDEMVQKIMKIVNERYMDQSLSIDVIANLSGFSPSYLGRMFKRLTSKSIVDYITEARVEKAKELLISTHLSVNDVSEQTGFTNSPYFYTIFKKNTGVTPNEFRKAALANNSEQG